MSVVCRSNRLSHYILSKPARLSELLYLPMPELPTSSQKSDSIQIGSNTSNQYSNDDSDDMIISGGKWEDEEERRFFEDIQDLKWFTDALCGVAFQVTLLLSS